MKLALTKPAFARRTCGECAKWMYDAQANLRRDRHGNPEPRPQDVRTPCATCPKKSPREAHKFELSPRNLRAVAVYFQARATMGRCVPQWLADDAIFAEVQSVIDSMVREADLGRSASEVLYPLIAILGSKARA